MTKTDIDVFKLPVFPAADVFPMMSDDELQELADDIKENGLREPLVIAEIEARGEELIDGRNRRAACEIAGITDPTTRTLNGEDPTAYVVSANIHRRHMTKGQQAMAVAMIYPKPVKHKKGGQSFATKEWDSGRLSKARTALAQGPKDLALPVLAGSMTLDKAYETAQERKKTSEGEEARLAKLRARYPELVDKVADEELSFEAALVEAKERDEKLKQQQETASRAVEDAVRSLSNFVSDEFVQDLAGWLKDDKFRKALRERVLRSEDLPDLLHGYSSLRDILDLIMEETDVSEE